VETESLRRWTTDLDALLAAVCASAGTAGPPERISAGLWRLGLIPTVGTRARDAYFVRAPREADALAAAAFMENHPGSVLFFASAHGCSSWGRPFPNVRLALTDLLAPDGDGLQFDTRLYAARLRAQEDDRGREPKPKAPPRGGSRAKAIMDLEKEVRAFLRSAQDYAFDTKKRNGTPLLLPRPTQEHFGDLVGVSESTVSRILREDERADNLRLLWELAADLDRIMGWDGRARM
jgi:hypothetical protein